MRTPYGTPMISKEKTNFSQTSGHWWNTDNCFVAHDNKTENLVRVYFKKKFNMEYVYFVQKSVFHLYNRNFSRSCMYSVKLMFHT